MFVLLSALWISIDHCSTPQRTVGIGRRQAQASSIYSKSWPAQEQVFVLTLKKWRNICEKTAHSTLEIHNPKTPESVRKSTLRTFFKGLFSIGHRWHVQTECAVSHLIVNLNFCGIKDRKRTVFVCVIYLHNFIRTMCIGKDKCGKLARPRTSQPGIRIFSVKLKRAWHCTA